MTMLFTLLSGVSLALAVPAPQPQPQPLPLSVAAQRDQDAALAARRQGRTLPLAEIQRRVVPTMRDAKYLGVDFDSSTAVYTLKFLRDGSIIWVMVDGRSGNVIGRSGR